MPRPLIGISRRQSTTKLDLDARTLIRTAVTPEQIERRLREKRSPQYMNAVKKLDSGGHTCNKALIDALIEAIRQELPEVTWEQLPAGIIAKCCLGAPYEVHILDISGSIIQHFKSAEPLPPLMERARSLALYGGYEFIEVYQERLRAVKADGSVAVVKD